jgi:beta-hydroxylase
VTPALAVEIVVLALFAGSILHVHFRGRERLRFGRQLTDHSSLLAPYNVLVNLGSKLPRRPVLSSDDFPELKLLRENWQTLREEALRLERSGGLTATVRGDDLGFESFLRRGWSRFYLKWYGEPPASARVLCPKSVELIEAIPSLHGAMFARLEPGRSIGKHRDPFAGALRYHLGLVTPNHEDCCIVIDGERHVWRDGEDIVFDETYIHRFQNLTDQPRIILFADIERPIANGLVRALNRFVIRHVVGITASRNAAGEPVGFANRLFPWFRRARAPLRRLREANRPAYLALKWGVLAGVLALALLTGSGLLR